MILTIILLCKKKQQKGMLRRKIYMKRHTRIKQINSQDI